MGGLQVRQPSAQVQHSCKQSRFRCWQEVFSMAVRARLEETTVIVAIASMPTERTATTGDARPIRPLDSDP
jgi:hypothetical protein